MRVEVIDELNSNDNKLYLLDKADFFDPCLEDSDAPRATFLWVHL